MKGEGGEGRLESGKRVECQRGWCGWELEVGTGWLRKRE